MTATHVVCYRYSSDTFIYLNENFGHQLSLLAAEKLHEFKQVC